MKTVPIMSLLLVLATGFTAVTATASTVNVKYVGRVELSTFDCTTITRSSFIRNTCYDPSTTRTVVQLNSNWYQYCGMSTSAYHQWLVAESMGRFYNANVKGRYRC